MVDASARTKLIWLLTLCQFMGVYHVLLVSRMGPALNGEGGDCPDQTYNSSISAEMADLVAKIANVAPTDEERKILLQELSDGQFAEKIGFGVKEIDDDSSEPGEKVNVAPVDEQRNSLQSASARPLADQRETFLIEAKESETKGDASDHTEAKIAWLMSFPNSGTSYTLLAVRRASGKHVASNYDSSALNKENPWLLYEGGNAPSWEGKRESPLEKPSNYVLTKTHCGGYSRNTLGDFSSVELFTKRCLEGFYSIKEGGKTTKKGIRYSPALVGKSVHVIRNPIDNIVARFHLNLVKNGVSDIRDRKDSRELFLEFCKAREDHMGDRLPEYLEDVPCGIEFYQYAQWHNKAFETENLLQLDSFILHYENFSTHWKKTLGDVLDFLELEWIHNPPEFISGKTYSHLYTAEERDAIRDVLRKMSSDETWAQIHHYFDEQ